ncbi:hypothetical protein D0T49_12155 [Paludibacter sp. 221]|uniref:hypothetical protein n=1 Tax=Paludibacter sp. 221 TaxID=2302939 RepID=UPI0013D199E1|nr:hypothetical protein [Paludibacter sp. 221]NDV47799.1 hypothetical protein [Paludibacter sp. 221]
MYSGIQAATTGNSVAYNGIELRILQADSMVNTGLSGMDDDNIAFWTGGDYDMAKKGVTATLLKKDGSGFFANNLFNWNTSGSLNVGIFQVLDDRIIVNGANGDIIITNRAIDDVASKASKTITKNDRGTLSASNTNPFDNNTPSPYWLVAVSDTDVPLSNYNIACDVEINAHVKAASYSNEGRFSQASIVSDAYVEVESNGIIKAYDLGHISVKAIAEGYDREKSDDQKIKMIVPVSMEMEGNMLVRIGLKNTRIVTGAQQGLGKASASIIADLNVKAVSTIKETIIGNDGLLVRQDSENEVKIKRDQDRLAFSIKGLKRDIKAVQSKEIYIDSDNTLKWKP